MTKETHNHLKTVADPKLSLFVTRLNDRNVPLSRIHVDQDGAVYLITNRGSRKCLSFNALNADRASIWYKERAGAHDFWEE